MQPFLVSQLSVVQGLPSSQETSLPAPRQAPPAHTSPVVQVTPSSQPTALLTALQSPARLQLSSVHGLLSLQTLVVPTHVPVPQLSPLVQALPSLQVTLVGSATDVQPFVLLQESVVQALPSSHGMAVFSQCMLLHLSVVQTDLSSQSASAPQSGAWKPVQAVRALPQLAAAQAMHAGSVTVALTKFEQLDEHWVETQTAKSPKQSAHLVPIG